MAAEKDKKIKSDNLLLTARVFYAMVEGAITWPALFSEGIDKVALQPMLNEIIATFLARFEATEQTMNATVTSKHHPV